MDGVVPYLERNLSAGNLYRAGVEAKLAAKRRSTPDYGLITDRWRARRPRRFDHRSASAPKSPESPVVATSAKG